MKLERLQVEVEKGVARVWMNRPAVRNAFDGLMVTELRKTLFDFGTDDSVRLVVLGGRGPVFCAGAEFIVHREFNFACLAAVHRDGGVGSLIGDRLRVVAVLGLVKRHDGEA